MNEMSNLHSMQNIGKDIKDALRILRASKPLVLNLTNHVTMDFVANALLAIGAAPIMSLCSEELEELITLASSIIINIGTLDKSSIKRFHKAAKLAIQYKKPLILDPVGAGATAIRTKTARELSKYSNVIRGNASEIISLHQENSSFGVEATNSTKEAELSAKKIAQNLQCVVVTSGAIDFITDGDKESHVYYGSNLMQFVTGMGCALTAVIGAFTCLSQDLFETACIATTYFSLCGQLTASNEKAQEKNKLNLTPHIGIFRTAFLDTLWQTSVSSS